MSGSVSVLLTRHCDQALGGTRHQGTFKRITDIAGWQSLLGKIDWRPRDGGGRGGL